MGSSVFIFKSVKFSQLLTMNKISTLSHADVLQLILGILTLVILFTGMFMVFSFSKFYPWYITKDFTPGTVSETVIRMGGYYCSDYFEQQGFTVGSITSAAHGHNLTKADCMQM